MLFRSIRTIMDCVIGNTDASDAFITVFNVVLKNGTIKKALDDMKPQEDGGKVQMN